MCVYMCVVVYVWCVKCMYVCMYMYVSMCVYVCMHLSVGAIKYNGLNTDKPPKSE